MGRGSSRGIVGFLSLLLFYRSRILGRKCIFGFMNRLLFLLGRRFLKIYVLGIQTFIIFINL